MISIDLLKNHPDSIATLAKIRYEVLGKIWLPEVTNEEVERNFLNHLNEFSVPLTFVAFDMEKPIGMCSLRENDGIRPELTPWLGTLVVDPLYQKQGIAKALIEATKQKAKELGFDILYLFAFDLTIPNYYESLGWQTIGMDAFIGHPVTVMQIKL